MNYRIVYCSQSRIAGTPQRVDSELQAILMASRMQNAARDITGALLFNGRAFAQVLEGPREAVDETFARICNDGRHTDVTLLESAYQVRRNFADWVMAYADESASAVETLQFDAVDVDPSGFAQQILRFLKSSVDARPIA